MEKLKIPVEISNFSSRIFKQSELSTISDSNYGVLNNCIDMSRANPGDIFVLTPIMVHSYAFGELVKPHLRTSVSKLNNTYVLAYQDVTFEQWEQGNEIQKIAG